jgi:hypothetical protein
MKQQPRKCPSPRTSTTEPSQDTSKKPKLAKGTKAASKLRSQSDQQPSAPQIALLIIDPQIDFHENGSLAVAGATAGTLSGS